MTMAKGYSRCAGIPCMQGAVVKKNPFIPTWGGRQRPGVSAIVNAVHKDALSRQK
jgi:hypothetical protein